MTDQMWDHEESLLSKKLIGKISNMKSFWNSVSDEDSVLQRKSKFATTEPFAGKEFLQENIRNKKERYANLLEKKSNQLKLDPKPQDPLKNIETKRKIKGEKGNTKEHLSFWEGVLEDKNKRNIDTSLTEKNYPGILLL